MTLFDKKNQSDPPQMMRDLVTLYMMNYTLNPEGAVERIRKDLAALLAESVKKRDADLVEYRRRLVDRVSKLPAEE